MDITIQVGGFLLAEERLDRVQALLRENAPQWAKGLHLFRYPDQRRPVDVETPGALAQTIRAAAMERGPLYGQLASRYGDPAERIVGSAEIRGADPSLLLVVGIDEYEIRPSGGEWLWGNWLGFDVCRKKVEGVPAVSWSRRILAAVCTALSPPFGHAEMKEQYFAKNISREGGGTRAVGLDVAKGLPGLYWLNFFGQPYRDLIGVDRLITAPAQEVREIDNGVLLMVHPDPQTWSTPEYRHAEGRVLDHLGRQYFFDAEYPNRQTVAPRFDLSPRPEPLLQRSISVDLEGGTEEGRKPRRQ